MSGEGNKPTRSEIARMGGYASGALTSRKDRQEVLERAIEQLAEGKTLEEIGKPLGISKQAMCAALTAYDGPGAAQARAQYYAGRMLEHIETMEAAQDPLDLGRARESFRAWSWLAERRCRDHFGSQPQVQISIGDGQMAALEAARSRINMAANCQRETQVIDMEGGGDGALPSAPGVKPG